MAPRRRCGVISSWGVEHILLGIDHLLFVLALLLIVDGRWRLVKTITAFTAAHSLTLAAATLGWVHVPPAPVEAVINTRTSGHRRFRCESRSSVSEVPPGDQVGLHWPFAE